MARPRTAGRNDAKLLAARAPVFLSGRSATLGEVAAACRGLRCHRTPLLPFAPPATAQLQLDPGPDSRERVLAVAPELIGETGLAPWPWTSGAIVRRQPSPGSLVRDLANALALRLPVDLAVSFEPTASLQDAQDEKKHNQREDELKGL